MSRSGAWFAILPVAAIAAPAFATTYLSIADAQRLMFPSSSVFAERPATLTPEQRRAIGRAAGIPAPGNGFRAWEVRSGRERLGWFFVDRVLGKHELITYAVALDASGAVRALEILDYRETYGGEVRNPHWRQQFVGRRLAPSLRLGRDIRNISGATLSCRHVTDGVRRILATFELVYRHA